MREHPRVVELVCVTLWERVVGKKPPWFPDAPRAERELKEMMERLQEENRRFDERIERELAEVGLTPDAVFGRLGSSKPAAPRFRDKLERSRPIRKRRDGACDRAHPAYRAAAVVSLLAIGGLLLLSFRALAVS